MREIVLFCEDSAHEIIIKTLVLRMAREEDVRVQLDWRTTRGGHGNVRREFLDFIVDLKKQAEKLPDLIVVATDSNCKGMADRGQEFKNIDLLDPALPIALALPNPHIERWLLLDGEAFRKVCGKGCNAPDQKCDRDRYKKLLAEAVWAAGRQPTLGGLEWAEDIIEHMNMKRAQNADEAFRLFTRQLSRTFKFWQGQAQNQLEINTPKAGTVGA